MFQLPSRITIYKFWFRNADGTRGILEDLKRFKSSYQVNAGTLNNHINKCRSDQYKIFKSGYQMNLDASVLHVKFKKDILNDSMYKVYRFNTVDEAETLRSLLVKRQIILKMLRTLVVT